MYDEIARLKRFLAELALDRHMLGELVREKLSGQRADARWPSGPWERCAVSVR
jgi:hypothetical protein